MLPTRSQIRVTVLLTLLATTTLAQAAPTPRHPTLTSLSPNARQLFDDSMRTAASSYDPSTSFLRKPVGLESNDVGTYMIRESSWYALGLLLRDQPAAAGHEADRTRATAILNAVLPQQFNDPATKWFGSFKNSPEQPMPDLAHATHFDHYDPNWRVFLGTTFQIILIEFPDRIPAELRARLYTSIDNALAGESREHRLLPSYSNIALMYGALWDFAATHNHNAEWLTQSAQWNESVYQLFKLHNAFNEYNSPTYYGVDLYGLALLRDYASTPRLRQIASEMEATLWNDIADFYHPALRNISGPYDRSYGMDMESYVTVVGVWLRTILPAAQAPLPTTLTSSGQPTDHVGDLWFAPHFVILGTRIPAAAQAKFRHLAAPHLVTHVIDKDRTATAYIGQRVIFGGESTNHTKLSGPTSQFHPATIQWRSPSGAIAWVRLLQSPPVDATATDEGLEIDAPGTLVFLIHAPGNASLNPATFTKTTWPLPGLTVTATTDAATFEAKPTGTPADDNFTLTYTNLTHLHLTIPQ